MTMCRLHKSEEYGKILLKQKDKQNEQQILNFASVLAKHLPWPATTIAECLAELIDQSCLTLEGDTLFQKRMVYDGKLSDTRAISGNQGQAKRNVNSKKNNFAVNFAEAKVKANTDIDNDIDNDNKTVTSVIKKEKQKKISLFRPDILPEFRMEYQEFKEALSGFIEMRCKKNKPLTQRAGELILRELDKLAGMDVKKAVDIINQSTLNGWQDVFPLRDKSQAAKDSTTNLDVVYNNELQKLKK